MAAYQNKYQRKQNIILSQKLQLSKEENQRQTIIIVSTSFLLLVLIIGGILFYRKQQSKNKLRQEAINNLGKAKKNLKENLEIKSVLDQERKATLAHRKRELIASSLKIANFKREIESILETDNKKLSSARLKTKLKILLKEEDNWAFFIKKFVDVHPDFFKNLKAMHPELTEKDRDFCVLIKLGLSNKEIATFLNISHQSVITKKYRLRKKIGLPTETDTLENWLGQFSKN